MSDEDILKHKWAALMELLFKHVFERDLLPVIELLSKQGIFQALVKEGGENYVLDMIQYTIKTAEISDVDKFKQLLTDSSDPLGRDVMTIFEQFQQREKQAEQQGMQQGKAEEKAHIAREMLKDGLEPERVAKIMKLPVSEIERLKQH